MNLKYILNLRHIPRTGWVLRGVPPAVAESVADHIFLTTLIAMDIAERLGSMGVRIDKARVLAMSIIHDIPEAVTGDVVRQVKHGVEEYFSMVESKAIEELGLQGYSELYDELSKAGSLEALVVKAADDIATILEGSRLVDTGYRQVEEIVVNVRDHLYRLINEKARGDLKGILHQVVSEYMGST